ncbi:MAG: helicase-related protein [Acidobacteriota bacterium]|nr:helicase-related protein [Acidobacteriota bacterium]
MRPGDVVVVRDECWTVARTETFERCTLLTLEGRGPGNIGRRFRAITPFDRVRALDSDRPQQRKRRTVLRAALAAIGHQRPALGLWTAADATLDLHAYQLEPALAVLRGATRVLLADAVGLGKTIQAGLILAELRARGLVDRALVLCPAGLRASWAAELRDRFGLQAMVLDHSTIAAGVSERPYSVNPWVTHPLVIASIDFVKRPEVLASAEGAAFDLVVADEAHHLTPASDRGRAVERLGGQAPWLVLMSATPHSGDQAAFDYLAGLGGHGDPLVAFRRGRNDVGLPADRRSHRLRIVATADEDRLLRAMAAYTRAIWQARGHEDRAVQLVAITLARRTASSAGAAGRTLTRRRALLAGELPSAPAQGAFAWDEVDEADGDEADAALACPGLVDQDAERRHLTRLIDLAQRASADSSKLRRLRRLLLRAGEPAVVFTEYRDTLFAAVDALAATFRLGAIHGGVPAAVRQEAVQQFQRGDLDVLVATDTAGEGLNLHHRCRLVIDLEVPWNPVRLEQRVGRVDRLGQQRRVHAVHLLHRGTVEDTVWQRLDARRRLADHALGAWAPPTDDDMARAVFDDAPLASPCARPVASMRVEEAASELARVASARSRAGRAAIAPERPVVSQPRARDDHGSAIAVVEWTQIGPAGGMLQRVARAFRVSLRRRDTAEAWRDGLAAIGAAAISLAPAPPLLPMREPMLARIAAARSRLASAPALHQASLFDRRAEVSARSRRDVAEAVDASLARRATSLGQDGSPTSHPRLIAIWPPRRQP